VTEYSDAFAFTSDSPRSRESSYRPDYDGGHDTPTSATSCRARAGKRRPRVSSGLHADGEGERGRSSHSDTPTSRHNKNKVEKGRRRGQSNWMAQMEDRLINHGRTNGLTELNQANKKSSSLRYSKEDILERFLGLFDDLQEQNKRGRARSAREIEILNGEIERLWNARS
jgi:hypothetical protein